MTGLWIGILTSALGFISLTGGLGAGAQSPTIVGRWIFEFKLADDATVHTVQFDGEETGKGTYLLLDRVSNLVPPASPREAKWSVPSQGAPAQIRIAGGMEFPIGNVGREPGQLIFEGSFSAADTLAGVVTFISDVPGAPTKTGSFTGRRDGSPSPRLAPVVEMLTLNDAGVVRRGEAVRIEWRVQASAALASQLLLLSVDNGATYIPITPLLEADQRTFLWTVPEGMGKAKKARLKIVVTDEKGMSGEANTDKFRIK